MSSPPSHSLSICLSYSLFLPLSLRTCKFVHLVSSRGTTLSSAFVDSVKKQSKIESVRCRYWNWGGTPANPANCKSTLKSGGGDRFSSASVSAVSSTGATVSVMPFNCSVRKVFRFANISWGTRTCVRGINGSRRERERERGRERENRRVHQLRYPRTTNTTRTLTSELFRAHR